MASPFPGMNPYLEETDLWFEFHVELNHAMRDILVPRVPPEYTVRIERGVVLTEEESGEILARFRPDLVIVPGGVPSGTSESTPRGARGAIAVEAPIFEAVEQVRLVIRRRGGEREVVTVIELFSPVNKVGPGREKYLDKRRQVLGTRTNLVEIDLLRAGKRMPVAGELPQADYVAFVFRGWERPRGWFWAWDVKDALPEIAIPLRREHGEVMLPLREALDLAYERGRYAGEIDYRAEPVPPLSSDQAAWADGLLREAGLRS